eukprot:Lithocolla_globosa_v1_NODE_692_length_3424_cov_7.464233.p2 type:complete len:113 gc:universal NODE_692_length_3424_cov_7.464233:1193-1531(+)
MKYPCKWMRKQTSFSLLYRDWNLNPLLEEDLEKIVHSAPLHQRVKLPSQQFSDKSQLPDDHQVILLTPKYLLYQLDQMYITHEHLVALKHTRFFDRPQYCCYLLHYPHLLHL